MNRISVIAASLLATLMLFGCSTMSDSDRAMMEQARQDAAAARASAASAKQSADAAVAAESATRQYAQQTGATPPSRTAAAFREGQRK